jgi:hypothetical protein
MQLDLCFLRFIGYNGLVAGSVQREGAGPMKPESETRSDIQPTGKYKFYKTFGHVKAPRVNRYPLWRWAVVLGVIALLYGFGTLAYLMINSARAEFEDNQLPRYDLALNMITPGGRYQVGDTAHISVILPNPAQFNVPVKDFTIELPPTFLDAFTVDTNKCTLELRANAAGVIRCPDMIVHGERSETLDIALRASRPGNYSGDIVLGLALAVPLTGHPWYIGVDSAGNYKMVLDDRKRLDLRIVPKP